MTGPQNLLIGRSFGDPHVGQAQKIRRSIRSAHHQIKSIGHTHRAVTDFHSHRVCGVASDRSGHPRKHSIGHSRSDRPVHPAVAESLHRNIGVCGQQHLTVRRPLGDPGIAQPDKRWPLIRFLNHEGKERAGLGLTIAHRHPHHVGGRTLPLIWRPSEHAVVTQCGSHRSSQQQVLERLEWNIRVHRPKSQCIGLHLGNRRIVEFGPTWRTIYLDHRYPELIG